ncbi:hypothetical protein CSHISOI_08530 [Colletotrichum shisoi]|uniref:Uncharacterized protein n=1 Tax=Colletotrichum shisoi TaxID=2078593 RepID=A0A5Q4BK05_9PEZI|nr:hypothetical protein CSHISOI_08530 [Colletotrichum shisoi]
MASRNLLAIVAVYVVLFLNSVLADTLPLLDHTSDDARTLWSRGDALPPAGYMTLTIPRADSTKTQVYDTVGGGELDAFAVLNKGGGILLAVTVPHSFITDDLNSHYGYRIFVHCYNSVIHFKQEHNMLYNHRRSLWASVSGKQLDFWREQYPTNKDGDIDITIWWEKDVVYPEDEPVDESPPSSTSPAPSTKTAPSAASSTRPTRPTGLPPRPPPRARPSRPPSRTRPTSPPPWAIPPTPPPWARLPPPWARPPTPPSRPTTSAS